MGVRRRGLPIPVSSRRPAVGPPGKARLARTARGSIRSRSPHHEGRALRWRGSPGRGTLREKLNPDAIRVIPHAARLRGVRRLEARTRRRGTGGLQRERGQRAGRELGRQARQHRQDLGQPLQPHPLKAPSLRSIQAHLARQSGKPVGEGES